MRDVMFLLGCFADFYEEIASIKLAFAGGRLPPWITVGDEPAPTRPADIAGRICAYLEALLRQQATDVRRKATEAEIRMHTLAQYVMAAMADEIFIFEIEWTGRDAWIDLLLERKLFRSRNAGAKFFELADQLLHAHQHSTLHADIASVFLLALQLGFKGRHRGSEGEAALRTYRQKLYQISNAARRHDPDRLRPAFEQAYQHCLSGDKDERLAPLSRWKVAGQIALAAYLAASTVVWVISLYPFEQAFGG
jgi:type VI secretion system protein ImpK